MYMYICIYVCVYIYARSMYILSYIYRQKNMIPYIRRHLYVYIHTYSIRACIDKCVCMHVYRYIFMQTYMGIHLYMHVHKYRHTYICIIDICIGAYMYKCICHTSVGTITLFDPMLNFPFDSSPMPCVTLTDYHVTCRFSFENQTQDTGSPDPIFVDLFWLW